MDVTERKMEGDIDRLCEMSAEWSPPDGGSPVLSETLAPPACEDLVEAKAVPTLIRHLSDARPTRVVYDDGNGTRTAVPVGYMCLDILLNLSAGESPVFLKSNDDGGWEAHTQEAYYFPPDVLANREAEPIMKRTQRNWSGAYEAGRLILQICLQLTDVETPTRAAEDVTIEAVLIPAGEFLMGSSSSDDERGLDEEPQRRVKITKAFYMGKYEVTQEQYKIVMGTNPSNSRGFSRPVERVSWEDAVKFCERLSQKKGKTIRLPTEAEWEYACRAGSRTKFSFGNNKEKLDDHAWSENNSDDQTHPGGEKEPNGWGLYDTHGNVGEWCSDWHQDSYRNLPTHDPKGPVNGVYRVVRGGDYSDSGQDCRSAARDVGRPGDRDEHIGFRIVVELI